MSAVTDTLEWPRRFETTASEVPAESYREPDSRADASMCRVAAR